MRDCSICKARAYCWEAVEPGSIMCGINLMQHGGTKSEPETPRSISVKLSPTFCAYCGKPLKIIGTERSATTSSASTAFRMYKGGCLMSNFQKDVQLLTDLQELISDAERTANMPGYAGAVFNAISPALKAAMPAAQKKARRQIDVLTRAKERLMELMEEPQK